MNKFRRITSVALAVSFIAVAISGLIMYFVHGPLAMRMHPVHNNLGLLMALSGIVHLLLNWKPLEQYLTSRRMQVVALGLLLCVGGLVAAGMMRKIDPVMMQKMEELKRQAHAQQAQDKD